MQMDELCRVYYKFIYNGFITQIIIIFLYKIEILL